MRPSWGPGSPGQGEAIEITRVNSSRSGAGFNQGQQFQVRPKGVHSHKGTVRPRGGPESTGPGEVQLWNTVTGSQFYPVEDHGQQGQVRPRWGSESPNTGEAKVGTTVTRSRVVSGADQNHQVQVRCRWQPHSPGPCEANLQAMQWKHVPMMPR